MQRTQHSVQRGINLTLENSPPPPGKNNFLTSPSQEKPLPPPPTPKNEHFLTSPYFLQFSRLRIRRIRLKCNRFMGPLKSMQFYKGSKSFKQSFRCNQELYLHKMIFQTRIFIFQGFLQKISEHLFSRTPPSDCISRLN